TCTAIVLSLSDADLSSSSAMSCHHPATTWPCTLSLHDALPIFPSAFHGLPQPPYRPDHTLVSLNPTVPTALPTARFCTGTVGFRDRKSTRLNPVTWPSRMPSSA